MVAGNLDVFTFKPGQSQRIKRQHQDIRRSNRMRWQGNRQSDQVEDQRGGRSARGPALAGGGIGLIVLVVLVMLMGGNPEQILQLIGQPPAGVEQPGDPAGGEVAATPENDEIKQFVATVLADTEDVWEEQFRLAGRSYQKPKLVLFTGNVKSACGFADSAMGPFYCPGDDKVYLDFSFFDELARRFDAPGDFAQAYVIAHEVGHHVQNLLGITDKVHRQKGELSEAQYNQLSVRLELQADFFAGVWAHHADRSRNLLEEGDVEEGLRAATAIGDDTLQKQARGYVVPDSFTHGTSAQRVRWFKKGLTTGDMSLGDTFSADEL